MENTGYYAEITSLNDSGPGSLRNALMLPGRKVIYVNVDGYVSLASNLLAVGDNALIVNPLRRFATKNHNVSFFGHVLMDNFRAYGPVAGTNGIALKSNPDGTATNQYAISHCSFMLSEDDNISIQKFQGTIYRSIVGNGVLTANPATRSKGMLLTIDHVATTVWECLIANEEYRFPHGEYGAVEVLRCVQHNPLSRSLSFSPSAAAMYWNIVRNVYTHGQDTPGNIPLLDVLYNSLLDVEAYYQASRIYISDDNIYPAAGKWRYAYINSPLVDEVGFETNVMVMSPVALTDATTQAIATTDDVLARVLAVAGPHVSDALIDSTKAVAAAGTGKMYDSIGGYGGLPDLS